MPNLAGRQKHHAAFTAIACRRENMWHATNTSIQGRHWFENILKAYKLEYENLLHPSCGREVEVWYVFLQMIGLSWVFGKGASIPSFGLGVGLERNRISVLKAFVPPHRQLKSSSFTGNISKQHRCLCRTYKAADNVKTGWSVFVME